MNRKLISAVVSILLIFIVLSCKKDTKVPATVSPQYTINFTLSAGTSPLAMNQVVSNGVKYKYYINQLRFYIGYPRLIKTDSTEVPLSNLFIVAYDLLNAHNSIYGTNFNFQIPAGNYIGIKFGIGVPPAILDTIKHYHNSGATDPLNGNYGMIWPTDPSVIRDIAIDMEADTSAAQNQPANRDYQFHILNDHNQDSVHLYTELVFADPFTISNAGSHTINLNLDFNNVFFNPSSPINLRQTPGAEDMFNNDPNGLILGLLIYKNFCNSLTRQ